MFIFSCYLLLIFSMIEASADKSADISEGKSADKSVDKSKVVDAVTMELLEAEKAISNVGLSVKDDLLQISNTIDILGKNFLGGFYNNFEIDDNDLKNWSEEKPLALCEILCSKYARAYVKCMEAYKASPEETRGCSFMSQSIQRLYPQFNYHT